MSDSTPNDLAIAQALASQYPTGTTPPSTPPPTSTATTGKLFGIVVGASALAFLFGHGKKPKYSKRTQKRYA